MAVEREMLPSLDTRRTVFFVSNFFFWLLGWLSLAVGVWLYIEKNAYGGLTPSSYNAMSAAGLCVAAGATVIVIAFVGCTGAFVRSNLLLIAYLCFVLLLFLLEFLVSLLALRYSTDVGRRVRLDLLYSLKRDSTSRSGLTAYGRQITWDHMQSELQCCGVDAPSDWFNNSRWPKSSYVPDSCCDPAKFGETGSMLNCGKGAHNDHLWFQQGCNEIYTEWLLEHVHIVGYMAVAFIVMEVFVLSSSIAFYVALRRRTKADECAAYRYTKGVSSEHLVASQRTPPVY